MAWPLNDEPDADNVSTRKLRCAIRLPEGDLQAIPGDRTSKLAASRRFVALSAQRLSFARVHTWHLWRGQIDPIGVTCFSGNVAGAYAMAKETLQKQFPLLDIDTQTQLRTNLKNVLGTRTIFIFGFWILLQLFGSTNNLGNSVRAAEIGSSQRNDQRQYGNNILSDTQHTLSNEDALTNIKDSLESGRIGSNLLNNQTHKNRIADAGKRISSDSPTLEQTVAFILSGSRIELSQMKIETDGSVTVPSYAPYSFGGVPVFFMPAMTVRV